MGLSKIYGKMKSVQQWNLLQQSHETFIATREKSQENLEATENRAFHFTFCVSLRKAVEYWKKWKFIWIKSDNNRNVILKFSKKSQRSQRQQTNEGIEN